MEKVSLDSLVEALIFASEKGISEDEIGAVLSSMADVVYEQSEISASLERINKKYFDAGLCIGLVKTGSGFQFLTRKQFYPVIQQLHLFRGKKKLSQAALETLAVIAYKQPVTKTEIEQIRGVNCDYTVQKLLEKELIEITGKSDMIGKPLLYSTTQTFMDYFGINGPAELPDWSDLEIENESIGDKQEL